MRIKNKNKLTLPCCAVGGSIDTIYDQYKLVSKIFETLTSIINFTIQTTKQKN